MSEHDKSRPATPLDEQDPAITALYRQSAQETPPAALDTRILQAAHAAVEMPEDAPAKPSPLRAWSLLGGLAAGVFVAVLVVKLLPYHLPSTAPAMKGRSAADSAGAGIPEQRPVESGRAPAPAAVPPVPPMRQDETVREFTAEPARKSASASPANAASERAKATAADIAAAAPAAPDSATPDAEFDRIVTLWKTDNTAEALLRFAAFRKRFPDFTPHESDLDLFKALQAELQSQDQTGEPGKE